MVLLNESGKSRCEAFTSTKHGCCITPQLTCKGIQQKRPKAAFRSALVRCSVRSAARATMPEMPRRRRGCPMQFGERGIGEKSRPW